MKNLKKVLALVLACATLFTMSSFAFSDVAEDASYLEAVTMLTKLGIINGYEDGTFLPDNTITRAEAAKVLVCALDAEDSAIGMADQELFTDVPASHWAAGYVNYAANYGIINGRGNGIFDPESPVSYEEIVKMVVAMLGYTPVADIKGGYPVGYLYVANNVAKITKGATGNTGDAAKRWVVARLVFNSLETKIMEPEKWSASDPEYIKGEDTLLKDYLEVTKLEGIVTDTYMVDGDIDADNRDVTIAISTIDGLGKKALDNAGISYETMPGEDYIVDANDTYAEDYLGYNVVAYVRDFDEGAGELVAIAPKSNKNSTLDVAFDDFVEDSVEKTTGKYIAFGYDVDGEEETAKVSLKDNDAGDAELNILENSIAVALNVKTKAENLIKGWADSAVTDEGFVRFLDNDGDGVYEYMFVEKINKEYVVDSITAKSYKIKDAISKNTIIFDVEDEDKIISFYKDDAQVDFSAIAEDDVLSVVLTGKNGASVSKPGDSKATIIKVYISSDKVEGYVSSTSSDKGYKIDGTYYKKSLNNSDAIKRSDEGTFYLNYKGRIAYANAEESKDGSYAFLLSANTDIAFDGDDPIYTLRFMNTDGEWIDADLAEKVTFIIGDGSGNKTNKLDLTKSADRGNVASETNNWLKITDPSTKSVLSLDKAKEQRVFKYTLNSEGVITKIYLPEGTTALEEGEFQYVASTNSIYKENSNKFSSFSKKGGVDESTVIFSVDGNVASAKKSTVTLETLSVFKDEEEYTATVYEYDGGVYGAMVLTGATNKIDDESALLVVSEVELTNDDDDDYFILTGFMGGEEVTLETVEADSKLSYESFHNQTLTKNELEAAATGSAFEVSLDGAGKIKTIRRVADAKSIVNAGYLLTTGVTTLKYAPTDSKADYYLGAIATTDVDNKGMVIDLVAKFKTTYADSDYIIDGLATAGASMKGNIYFVEQGLRKGNDTVTVADSIADFVDSMNDSMQEKDTVYSAFVKTYDDDETIDIVVYELKVLNN